MGAHLQAGERCPLDLHAALMFFAPRLSPGGTSPAVAFPRQTKTSQGEPPIPGDGQQGVDPYHQREFHIRLPERHVHAFEGLNLARLAHQRKGCRGGGSQRCFGCRTATDDADVGVVVEIADAINIGSGRFWSVGHGSIDSAWKRSSPFLFWTKTASNAPDRRWSLAVGKARARRRLRCRLSLERAGRLTRPVA